MESPKRALGDGGACTRPHDNLSARHDVVPSDDHHVPAAGDHDHADPHDDHRGDDDDSASDDHHTPADHDVAAADHDDSSSDDDHGPTDHHDTPADHDDVDAAADHHCGRHAGAERTERTHHDRFDADEHHGQLDSLQ
jgi:hypothetical protein